VLVGDRHRRHHVGSVPGRDRHQRVRSAHLVCPLDRFGRSSSHLGPRYAEERGYEPNVDDSSTSPSTASSNRNHTSLTVGY
jgi:hypothetical protein